MQTIFLRYVGAISLFLFAGTVAGFPVPLTEIVNLTTSSTSKLVNDGHADAFDGAFWINAGGAVPGDLSLTRRIDTIQDIRAYRVLDIFTNNTGSAVSTTIDYNSNLGSNGDEFIVENGVYRSISFQERDFLDGTPIGEFDPVVAFTFGNNAFTTSNASGLIAAGDFDVTFDIMLDPGESIGLLQFATLIKDNTDRTNDVAVAISYTDDLIASPYLDGLSGAEQASIRNFSVVPVPAAIWLFGSALGLLGWARLKTT